MTRRALSLAVLGIVAAAPACVAQTSGQTALQNYFVGKQVVLKIDMPGTQQGVDLKANSPMPMDWRQYSARLKQYGAAIRSGDRATVTTLVVKKNLIEFQLDGGGFGTFWDNSSTTVAPNMIGKSDYEKRLEDDIRRETNYRRKQELQRDLDRERSRRERQQAANNSAAMIASEIKSQQVADQRIRGGSRFNLRWAGTIPQNQLTPENVMQLLDQYVDFSGITGETAMFSPSGAVAANAAPAPAPTAAVHSPLTDLMRGMTMDEVTAIVGTGRELSQSVSEENLKTQVFEYLPDNYRVEVTYVDGIVVRYSISSR